MTGRRPPSEVPVSRGSAVDRLRAFIDDDFVVDCDEAREALGLLTAENERLKKMLNMLVLVSARYLDTGRGDLDGAIDFVRESLGESGGSRG